MNVIMVGSRRVFISDCLSIFNREKKCQNETDHQPGHTTPTVGYGHHHHCHVWTIIFGADIEDGQNCYKKMDGATIRVTLQENFLEDWKLFKSNLNLIENLWQERWHAHTPMLLSLGCFANRGHLKKIYFNVLFYANQKACGRGCM